MENDTSGKLNKSHSSNFNLSKTIIRWTCYQGYRMTCASDIILSDMIVYMYVANTIASKCTKQMIMDGVEIDQQC